MRTEAQERPVIDRVSALSIESGSARSGMRVLYHSFQDALINRLWRRPPPDHSRLLNLGCGGVHYTGWVNADRLNLNALMHRHHRFPDWLLDATEPWNCPTDHWEGVYTEHMLEHLPYNDAINVLKEVFRTLKPDRWLRVVVPDARLVVDFYDGRPVDSSFAEKFRYGAEALANLTQRWGHVSVWDAPLLSAVLREIGFESVSTVTFGQGTDRALIYDSPARRWESLYIEARKPAIAH
jgi:predicted SAM-dependent methyltransferase